MLSAGWLIAIVIITVLLTSWITFTATRLDRLHARVDAAQAALDAQLVRRAAALLQLADSASGIVADEVRARLEAVAGEALNASKEDREAAENAVGRAINGLGSHRAALPGPTAEELREAGARVLIARRFYNDAVRDTRALRSRRMPRLLRLAGHREMPQFFDIDDTYDTPEETPHRKAQGGIIGADQTPQEESAR